MPKTLFRTGRAGHWTIGLRRSKVSLHRQDRLADRLSWLTVCHIGQPMPYTLRQSFPRLVSEDHLVSPIGQAARCPARSDRPEDLIDVGSSGIVLEPLRG